MKIQNGDICGPKGWDCMEENSNKNFSCSVSCQGIYADVQMVKEQLTKSIGGDQQEEDKEKVSMLVKQYKEFKKMNLPNVFFNPKKGTEKFCK